LRVFNPILYDIDFSLSYFYIFHNRVTK